MEEGHVWTKSRPSAFSTPMISPSSSQRKTLSEDSNSSNSRETSWMSGRDDTGRKYFYNKMTRVTTYDFPSSLQLPQSECTSPMNKVTRERAQSGEAIPTERWKQEKARMKEGQSPVKRRNARAGRPTSLPSNRPESPSGRDQESLELVLKSRIVIQSSSKVS